MRKTFIAVMVALLIAAPFSANTVVGQVSNIVVGQVSGNRIVVYPIATGSQPFHFDATLSWVSRSAQLFMTVVCGASDPVVAR